MNNWEGFFLGTLISFFLTSFFHLILVHNLVRPNERKGGFRKGACTVTCGTDQNVLVDGSCYCIAPNKDRIFKEIPKYHE